jgi:hypothetical protein
VKSKCLWKNQAVFLENISIEDFKKILLCFTIKIVGLFFLNILLGSLNWPFNYYSIFSPFIFLYQFKGFLGQNTKPL